jgi:hypothetical protein
MIDKNHKIKYAHIREDDEIFSKQKIHKLLVKNM